jgi:radical SAM superfamily enzyme YgiQ (UPF0313 family)
MSWKLKKKAQALVAGEEGSVSKDWGGRVSVALVYPNTYAVGMSNLGFQTIYEHLNALPDAVCERVFFPDPEDADEYERTGTEPFSLESLRPLRDFDLVGFSMTYEGDYINVLRLLRRAGIRRGRRIAGRVIPSCSWAGCAFSNPEPWRPSWTLSPSGKEELVGEIIAAYGSCRAGGSEGPPGEGLRQRVIARLKPLQGIYVPGAYDVRYAADGTIGAVTPRDADVPAVVIKRRLGDVNGFETRSILKTPKAEYGHMALLEVGKGCGRGCRFCLEGQVYRPVRHRSLESLRESVAQIAKESKRVGLVGACVSDYPWIGDLMKMLEEYGVEVSISSLRADSLTEDLVAALNRGGHRTLTMAPEAGTERLRRVIRKVITDEQLYAACDLLRKYGIPTSSAIS